MGILSRAFETADRDGRYLRPKAQRTVAWR
jgi:hypothetical protein